MPSDTLLEHAIGYLQSVLNVTNDDPETFPLFTDRVCNVAELKLPKGTDAVQVDQIIELLNKYAADPSEKKPISIAIFGPPGSGKSTFVENISENVKDIYLAKTINLTQVTDSESLAETFEAAIYKDDKKEGIPVFFFDEFDTMRRGTPRGWLSWFLAPAEDAVFLAKGNDVKVGKAVFIFAGGTAETLDEFSELAKLDPEAYRARKVPDFVSRLRGAIDIGGVNGHFDERIIRRTIALGFLLDTKKAKALGKAGIRQILEDGHFVHGVRSLKTFLNAGTNEYGIQALPETILRQHFSRGKFDGLTVGISAGLDEDGSQPLSMALTQQLLQSGAALAYAGSFFPDGTLDAIKKQADETPKELVRSTGSQTRIVNYLGYPASQDTKTVNTDVFAMKKLATLSLAERTQLGVPTRGMFRADEGVTAADQTNRLAAWALSMFRLRIRVAQDVGAVVAFGGKDDGSSWGRMPGIAEEVMIAIALGKPVYILGGAGGASLAIGKLLGLSDAPVARADCLEPSSDTKLEDVFANYNLDFSIPGVFDSPTNLDEVRHFFFHRGVSTSAWPANGLNVEQNRALFSCAISTDIPKAVSLILQGLGRIKSMRKF